MVGLKEELLKSIWHAFTALDLDRSGKVSKSQLKASGGRPARRGAGVGARRALAARAGSCGGAASGAHTPALAVGALLGAVNRVFPTVRPTASLSLRAPATSVLRTCPGARAG